MVYWSVLGLIIHPLTLSLFVPPLGKWISSNKLNLHSLTCWLLFVTSFHFRSTITIQHGSCRMWLSWVCSRPFVANIIAFVVFATFLFWRLWALSISTGCWWGHMAPSPSVFWDLDTVCPPLLCDPWTRRQVNWMMVGFGPVLGSSHWVTCFSGRFSHWEPTVLVLGENRGENQIE
jgi:hypothetical protein